MKTEDVRIESEHTRLSATLYGDGGKCLLALLPLGEERKGCIRPVYELFANLSECGWKCLLFDYVGTGDSPGEFEDLSLQKVYRNSFDALNFLRESAKVNAVSLLALRSGAIPAMQLAQNIGISKLCFWEPVFDGKEWLREISRRSKFRGCGAAYNNNDIDGYLFGDKFAEDLNQDFSEKLKAEIAAEVISISGTGSQTRAAGKIAAKLQAGCKTLKMPPFWLESGVVDYSELIARSVEFFIRDNSDDKTQ